MTDNIYTHSPCLKCKTPTSHKSELCQACRAVPCMYCKAEVKSGNKICKACKKSARRRREFGSDE